MVRTRNIPFGHAWQSAHAYAPLCEQCWSSYLGKQSVHGHVIPRLIRIHCVTLHVSSGVRFIHVAWHACCAYSAWPVAHGAAPVDPMQPPYARAAPHAHFFMRCGRCFTSRAARPVATCTFKTTMHARFVGPTHVHLFSHTAWVHTRRAIYTSNAPSHRSDWHGWKGHDGDIAAFGIEGGFTPGHELSGVVHEVGEGVTRCVRPACLHSFWPIFIARSAQN